jgi:antirestriction protein
MEQLKQKETKGGIYFANLEAYNQGRLVGGWLYPLQYETLNGFLEAIKQITRGADEIAVHDYDDFPNMGEYPCHEELYLLAHAIDQSYIDDEILIKYMENQHDYSSDLVQEAEDNFICRADSFKDFAYEYAEDDIQNIVNNDAVQFVFNNFDYDGYARDLEHSFTVIELDNYDVAIFNY